MSAPSASVNPRPQSIAIVVSASARAAQFIPTSLRPPRGMKRSRSIEELFGAELEVARGVVKEAIASLTRVFAAVLRPGPHEFMRRFLAIVGVVCLWASFGAAQEEVLAEDAEDIEDVEVTGEAEPPSDDGPPPQLRAPSFEGLDLPSEGEEEVVETTEEVDVYEPDEFDFESEEQMAAEDAELLGFAEPPASDPTLASWTNPRPVFSLNGYFRVRAVDAEPLQSKSAAARSRDSPESPSGVKSASTPAKTTSAYSACRWLHRAAAFIPCHPRPTLPGESEHPVRQHAFADGADVGAWRQHPVAHDVRRLRQCRAGFHAGRAGGQRRRSSPRVACPVSRSTA